jgi:type IV secretory pathway VirB2 component (pilin)
MINTLNNFLASAPSNNRPLVPDKSIICPNGRCPLFDPSSFKINSREDIVQFIINIAKILTYIAVPIAVIMIIYTGITAIFGIEKNPLAAIVRILIGLAVVILAYTLTSGFSDVLTGSININQLF